MMEIKGKLIAIGGAEDKGTEVEKVLAIHHNLNFFGLGILRRIVEEAGGIMARIEVITTASMIPFEVGNNYLEAFGRIGCTNIGVMHIRTREDVQNEEYTDRIQNCNAVMFTGGNQLRLTSNFGGTKLLRIIQNRYKNEPFIVAGTSAGAMAMSNTMIYDGDATKAHLKGEVKITTGLAFMDKVIFDSHFEKRGRFVRLSQAVGANPSCIGIGLGEDTGMLISEGNKMEAIGSGLVIIIDGHDIRHSNIADIPEGNPMSVENLRVHLCAKGNGFWCTNANLLNVWPKKQLQ
ncbi:MAG: cyanophycinase [Segetibacter sp.]